MNAHCGNSVKEGKIHPCYRPQRQPLLSLTAVSYNVLFLCNLVAVTLGIKFCMLLFHWF